VKHVDVVREAGIVGKDGRDDANDTRRNNTFVHLEKDEGSEIIYHALLFTRCRCLVVSRGKKENNDMTTVIAGEAEWNRTRAVLVSYLMVLGALLAGYFFYQHAVRYTQSYDVNCAAPGILVSEIWSADFVMQGLTGKQFHQQEPAFGGFLLVNWFEKLFPCSLSLAFVIITFTPR